MYGQFFSFLFLVWQNACLFWKIFFHSQIPKVIKYHHIFGQFWMSDFQYGIIMFFTWRMWGFVDYLTFLVYGDLVFYCVFFCLNSESFFSFCSGVLGFAALSHQSLQLIQERTVGVAVHHLSF